MKQLDLIDAPKPSKYFPDQPVVKGADVIYRPAGNAGEYAPLATNPYSGCGHQCLYCYVPNAMRMRRPVFDAGAVPRKGFGPRLNDGNVARHTLERLDSFVKAVAGKRLTYKALIA